MRLGIWNGSCWRNGPSLPGYYLVSSDEHDMLCRNDINTINCIVNGIEMFVFIH